MYKTAQDEIKRIVNSAIKAVLKDLDYRKKGNTWNLRDGELIKVVNIQLSSGNTSEQAKFTINLGIYNQKFQKERGKFGKVDEENVKEYDCEIRERLGTLSVGNDFWWKVFDDRENEEVLQDLETKFIGFALPWLESFKNLEDEYSYFAKRENHHSAYVAAYILKKDSVLDHLRKSLEDANPYFAKATEKWMSKRGLTF